MDIVLGVSMTPTTVRMVLVEGEKADGVTVDHDVFDVTGGDGSATLSAADQVIAAVLGTQESAAAGGHQLKATGVTWSDHSDASALRDALTAHGIDDVMLVSEGHAAAALAEAVGHAVGYGTTALLFIDRDAATLSVVKTDDGSVVKVLGRSLHSSDAMAVLTEMAAAVAAQDSAPQGMFVVGAGVDVSSVKAHLENLVSLPVSAPDEPELALARGAALAAASAPAFEASTVGLAYSQDPEGTTAGSAYAGLAALPTEMAAVGTELDGFESAFGDEPLVEEGRKPFLLVGSALTSVFVIGVVALVISLAVSIRPTVDQRPAPAEGAVIPAAPVKPAAPAPAPVPVPEAQPAPQAPPPAPPPETIKAPIPVVQEAPQPRTVVVDQQPAAAPQAPPPAAPVPEAPPPAPVPVAPAPVLPAPAPIYNPPGYIQPPVVMLPPILSPPVIEQPRRSPWQPPRQRQSADEPDYPWQPPSRQSPGSQYPYPGSGSDGSGDWGPGSGSDGRRGGDNTWNPGGSGGRGGDGGGRGGDSIWPWPFGGH
ncbi:hypothetical protein [Mycobacterium sp. 155]|uniref:DUF7159 family protein n=1 Tax=Mycobacterium sp. 155 TaxID=1157943 RepID=UPI00039C53C3|nr:hypothetical protein [Mycobacterium sp. 155]